MYNSDKEVVYGSKKILTEISKGITVSKIIIEILNSNSTGRRVSIYIHGESDKN